MGDRAPAIDGCIGLWLREMGVYHRQAIVFIGSEKSCSCVCMVCRTFECRVWGCGTVSSP